MGHEMGHYVMNHIPKFLFFLAVLSLVSFAYLYWGSIGARALGSALDIREVSDPAVLRWQR